MRSALILCLLALTACGAVSGCSPPPGGLDDITEGFTIILKNVGGARHIQNVKLERDTLEKAGWRNVNIVHKTNYSQLLWGKYRTIDSAQDDLHMAKEHKDAQGRVPFIRAVIIPMPGKNVGRAEWNLLKAPGTYTVLMAIYFNVPEDGFYGRKQAAADLCEKYRDLGYEAYYYHGPGKSYTTIGTFPDSAVQMIPGSRGGIRTTTRDQQITKIIQEFPQLSVNERQEIIRIPDGTPGAKRGKKIVIISKPYPIRIPRLENQNIEVHISTSQRKRR